MTTFPPPLSGLQEGGEREEERRDLTQCALLLLLLPHFHSAPRRTHGGSAAITNTRLLPDSGSLRAVSVRDDVDCDDQRAGGAPGLWLGVEAGAVIAEVCSHCVLSGAGEEDVSAAAGTPPIPATTLDY